METLTPQPFSRATRNPAPLSLLALPAHQHEEIEGPTGALDKKSGHQGPHLLSILPCPSSASDQIIF